MNIYHSLNEMLSYIEDHLEEPIEASKLAQFLSVNEYTMQKIFSLLSGVTLAEYIRKRRLSNAGSDLYKGQEKIIDIAIKYQYENPTSFSRAFEKFHRIKPSQVSQMPDQLNFYPKLVFEEALQDTIKPIPYRIVRKEKLVLFGQGIKTTEESIGKDAPAFFAKMLKQYKEQYDLFDYGMTVYEERFVNNNLEYWVLYEKDVPGFQRYEIPASSYITFRIPSQEANDIQKVTNQFYLSFAPNCNYSFRPLPELEYYHDDVTDFMIPIENE